MKTLSGISKSLHSSAHPDDIKARDPVFLTASNITSDIVFGSSITMEPNLRMHSLIYPNCFRGRCLTRNKWVEDFEKGSSLDLPVDCKTMFGPRSRSRQGLLMVGIRTELQGSKSIPIWFFQSFGFGTRAGLMQYVQGIFSSSVIPGPLAKPSALRPILVRNVSIRSPNLDIRVSYKNEPSKRRLVTLAMSTIQSVHSSDS